MHLATISISRSCINFVMDRKVLITPAVYRVDAGNGMPPSLFTPAEPTETTMSEDCQICALLIVLGMMLGYAFARVFG